MLVIRLFFSPFSNTHSKAHDAIAKPCRFQSLYTLYKGLELARFLAGYNLISG